MRILLITGGWSSERDVALRGAEVVKQALEERGHQVTPFDLDHDFSRLIEAAAGHDAAFLNLHGAPGEDGLVQALLDRTGCPYQGAGPVGSFLALHKAAAKTLCRAAGLTTPDWRFLPRPPQEGWEPEFGFPVFVKSNTGGSSLQLFRVENATQLGEALAALFAEGIEAIVEPLIVGREVTCGVLGDKALPPVLIVPKRSFFDHHDKYAADGAQEICPAPLSPETTARVQAAALAAHRALGLRDYSRTDFILREDGELFLLEVNTLPGMTQASLVPKEAAAAGISFGDLLERLLTFAVERARAKSGCGEDV